MSIKLDKKDLKIIETLRENARLSSHKIAKKTLIPVTTVNNRIKKLRASGIIKRYTLELDKEKTGKTVSAVILVKLDNIEEKKKLAKLGSLEKTILKIEIVDEVMRLMGAYDILIKVSCGSIKEVNDFLVNDLRMISAVKETQSIVVLEEWKK